ncbi:MAG: hypothetical protein S4CHLAM81_05360 [Chlamydiales bacterium]|nr:hypothetical protein [Chlamydiales bacterium]MCH9635322.1 hypothetical protein [Chlamydiales bacterium]MCH9703495.1 hypothetical protein [Chlamydiota bacterium]
MKKGFIISFCLLIGALVWNQSFSTSKIVEVSLPQFLIEQIKEDTQQSVQNLDEVWERHKNRCVRFKIFNHKLYAQTNQENNQRFQVISSVLQNLATRLPNLDFICDLGDCYDGSDPIFTFARNRDANGSLLMPDCEALNSFDRKYLYSAIRQSCTQVDWIAKEPTIFWRGGATGPAIYEVNDAKINARLFLVQQGKTLSYINAALTSYGNSLEHLAREEKEAYFILGNRVSPVDSLKFKYLIDIDGNSCCYSRTFWILLSNSLMFKQTTRNTQWYYKGLQPFVHYIPVANDLEDLHTSFEWAVANDEQCKQIAEQASLFAENHLLFKQNQSYLYHLLIAYANNFQDPVIMTESDRPVTLSLKKQLVFRLKRILKKAMPCPVATRLAQG